MTQKYSVVHRGGWGRYTQVDPLGIGTLETNPYRYVKNNSVNLQDPFGLVALHWTFTKKDSFLGDGGKFGLVYASVKAQGKCVCSGDKHYIRLTADVDLGFMCSGKTSCTQEAWHANIASAFVAKNAQEWAKYEKEPYDDPVVCKAMAAFFAKSIESDLLNESLWPTKLLKDFYQAEDDYETTYHGFWCGFMSGPCAW